MEDFFRKYADRIKTGAADECWPWIGSHVSAGYGNFTRDGKVIYAHRASFEAANGIGSAVGWVIRHTCDNKPCVNPKHLLSGTHKDNNHDAWERGQLKPLKGEAASRAILTDKIVLAARTEVSAGTASIAELARKHGVAHGVMHAAVTGESWQHLEGAAAQPGYQRGEKRHNAILSAADVRDIRRRLEAGERGMDLALRYGVKRCTISAVKHGRNWSHA